MPSTVLTTAPLTARHTTNRRPQALAVTALTAITAAHIAGRLIFIEGRPGPKVTDEIGYLINARVLAGGPPGDLSCCTVYSGGYSLLLAPIAALQPDPEALYRAALLLGVGLTAAVCPVLYLLARTAWAASRGDALAAAAVGAAVPSLVIQAGFAWTEALLPLLIASWLLTVAIATDPRRGPRARTTALIASGFLVAWLLTVHVRTAPLVLLHIGLLASRALTRGMPVRGWLAGAGTLVGGVPAGHLLNNRLAGASWPGRPDADPFLANVAPNLADLEALTRVGVLATGSLWTLSTATGALAATGAVAMVVDLGRRGPISEGNRGPQIAPRSSTAAALIATLTLTATAGLAVLAALVVGPEVTDPTYWVYGRYVEPIAPVLVAAGILLLVRMGRRTNPLAMGALVAIPVAISAAAIALLLGYVGPGLTGASTRPLAVVGLAGPAQSVSALHPIAATASAAAVLAVIAAAVTRTGGAALSALVAVAAAVASIASFQLRWLGPHDAAAYPDRQTLADVVVLRAAEVIAWREPDPAAYGPYTFAQFFLPEARIEIFAADTSPPAGADVVVGTPGWIPDPGWIRTADSPDGELELWVRG